MAINPLHKLQDAVVGTVKGVVKDPVGSAGKAVSQARETVAVGRTVAEHVVGGVVGGVASGVGGVATGVASGVAARVGRGERPTPASPGDEASGTTTPESAPTPITEAPTKKAGAKKAATTAAAPAAKKAPGTRPRVTKPPVTDLASKVVAEQAKHQPVKKAPAGPENPIDAAADPALVDATPSDLAKKVAKKAPAKKTPAQAAKTASTSPAKKATAGTSPRKAATPSGRLPVPGSAAGKEPLSAAELAAGAGEEVITPVGTRGADVAHNPDTTDTDLQQPGTEPLVDPATTKAVKSESQTLSKAARTKKS